jgi:uncharacterized membrane protein YhiD involved in acid resistance
VDVRCAQRIQLNDVSILLAHDLIHGLTKEFSILLRVAVGADIMTKHYAAAVVSASPFFAVLLSMACAVNACGDV